MSELRIECQLGRIKKSPRWYILGEVWRGRQREKIEISTRTTDLNIASQALTAWAEEVAADYEKQKQKTMLRAAGVNDERYEVTLSEAIDIYMQQRIEDGKDFKRRHEVTQLDRMRKMYGHEIVFNIEPERAVRMAKRLYPNASAATRRRYGTATIAALYNAVAAEYPGFPAKKWRHEKMARNRRPSASREWVAKFMELTDHWTPPIKPTWTDRRQHYNFTTEQWRMLMKTTTLFLFTTGARIGEMAEITWRDVDFENRRVNVSGEFRKNGKDHEKILTPQLVAALSTLAQNTPSDPHLRVFPFLKVHDASKALNKRIKQICGDELTPLTSHSLGGHGAVAQLAGAGLTNRQISEIVGKSESTINLYGELSEKENEAVVNRTFGEIFPHSSPVFPEKECVVRLNG